MKREFELHAAKVVVNETRSKTTESLVLSFKETVISDDGQRTHINVKDAAYDAPPHEDLKKALLDLRVHFGLLTDRFSLKRAKDPEELERIVITGISFYGDDLSGVVIKGYYKSERGQIFTMNPKIELNTEEENYKLIGLLKDNVKTAEKEVLAYMIDHKRAPDQQVSLFGEEQPELKGLDELKQEPEEVIN